MYELIINIFSGISGLSSSSLQFLFNRFMAKCHYGRIGLQQNVEHLHQ